MAAGGWTVALKGWSRGVAGAWAAVVIVACGAGVGRADDLTWTGQSNGKNDGNWTTKAANMNWKNNAGATSFANGDDVTFDDSAPGSTAVTIRNDGVAPGKVLFDIANKNYTLSGGT